ncbi:MAG: WYL domain-containing protein [Candidatus Riflebacteria bacterium]|nr:WYL domain-containing protein [Candidatus Riflebacteria bacterium]
MSRHLMRRYALIIESLKNKNYPSFETLKDYLISHNIETSARTIQRDIEQIRQEFGIEIRYDRFNNGYFIDTEASINVESFFRLLEIISTTDLIIKSLADGKEIINNIEFEAMGCLQGLKSLGILLHAINIRRLVKFEHENFHTGKVRNYTVNPCFLKEYQYRLYLVGRLKGKAELWSFGLDRIRGLSITEEPCEKITGVEKLVFANTIGLTYSIENPEEVILSFSPVQGKYVKSLPWHKTQRILEDNETQLLIRLQVVPNFELSQKILMNGDSVKVIKPLWFAKEIKETLEAALKNYK